ncbi:High affinity Ca2+/Mn2+ P-type ATPase-like protein, partial [Cladochytrium tenue]
SLEAVMDKCTRMRSSSGEIKPITDSARELVRMQSVEISKQGLRCIFCAMGQDPSSLVFVGFFAMQDPPRHGIAECISTLTSGGVRVVMITGDSGAV